MASQQSAQERLAAIVHDNMPRDDSVRGMGESATRSAVSRAAYMAASLQIGRGVTIGNAAEYLGVDITPPRAEKPLAGVGIYEHVTAAERAEFGYGTAPEPLIRDVKAAMQGIMPENGMSPRLVLLLAARTMSVVQQNRFVDSTALREQLMALGPDHPLLLAMPAQLSAPDIGVAEAIVATTHYIAADFYRTHLTEGGI